MVKKAAIGIATVVVLGIGGIAGSQIINQSNDDQKIEKQKESHSSSESISAKTEESSSVKSGATSSSRSAEYSSTKQPVHIIVHNADEAINQLKKILNDEQLRYSLLAHEEDMYLISAHYDQKFDIENKEGQYIVYENGDVQPEKQVPQDAVKFDKYKQVHPDYPVTPKEKVTVVHNAQEAVDLQRKLMQENGEDVNGDFTYAGSQNPNGTYQVIVKSTALQQAGGSGTVGVYIIDPDGTATLRQ